MTDDTYPNAGRDSGYVDAEGKPVGENLVNILTEHIARLETKMLTHNVKVTDTLGNIAKQGDAVARNQIDLASKVNQSSYNIVLQLDAFKNSQDTILDELRAVSSSLGKTQSDITAIVDRMDARDVLNDERYEASQEFQQQSLEDRERLNAAVAALTAAQRAQGERIESYIAGNKRDEIGPMKRDIEQIKRELQRLAAERGGDGNR